MALYGAWTRVLMELTASMFGLVAIACFLAVFIQRVSGFGYGIIVMMFYPLRWLRLDYQNSASSRDLRGHLVQLLT